MVHGPYIPWTTPFTNAQHLPKPEGEYAHHHSKGLLSFFAAAHTVKENELELQLKLLKAPADPIFGGENNLFSSGYQNYWHGLLPLLLRSRGL
jgi:hypothetical protein